MTTKALPKTASEWEHYLSGLDTPEKMNAAMASGEFKEATASYVDAKNKERDDLLASIRADMETTLVDMLKNSGASVRRGKGGKLDLTPPVSNGVNLKYSTLQNKKAVGAPLNGVYDSLEDFLQCAWHNAATLGGREERENKLRIQNTYQEKVPADGGFLVPEEFRSELLRLSLETAIMRPRARVVPMGSNTLRFPAIDSTTNAGSVYGGIVAYWTEEGAELVASQAKFMSLKLEAWKLTALAEVTNELVRDAAGGFGMYVETLFPEAVSYFEDLAFLRGTGVGQPKGALLAASNPALVTVSKESSQAADTINWFNIVKMYSRMTPTSLNRAIWIVTPDALPQLMTMTIPVKNVAGTENVGGSAISLMPNPDNANGAPVLTLLGRPVVITEKAPGLLGDVGDISFIDPGMYLIGDRQQMEVESSAHAKFTSDKTVYRVIERVDGQPWVQSAFTPANSGPTLSPFVNLETR